MPKIPNYVFFVLISLQEIFVSGIYDGLTQGCTFGFESSGDTHILTESLGKYEAVFTSNYQVTIKEGGFVKAYCSAGLQFENYDQLAKSIRMSCINGNTLHTVNDTIVNEVPPMDCENNYAKFYHNQNSTCPNDGYFYEYDFDSKVIVLAEFCYSFAELDTIYVHYVMGERTRILEKQLELNPNNQIDVSLGKVSYLPGLSHEFPGYFSNVNNYNYSTTNFEIDDLVPFFYMASIFQTHLKCEDANKVVWWKALKNENWERFTKILYQKSISSNPMEIFAGKSGAVSNFNNGCDLDQELTFEMDQQQRTIPLYIWNYIVPRDNPNNDFVVVGVNTPFFKGEIDDKTIFCKDICDDIEWLKSFKNLRKMPALGYIFCCSPEDAKNVLDGFPLLEN